MKEIDRMDILSFEAVLDELTQDINGDYEEGDDEEDEEEWEGMVR